MKTYKRILAVLLCVVMTLTAAPLSGFVGLELPSLFNFKAEAATYSGTCGDNLTWTLDTETGVLNITGTGAMYDWTDESPAPWYSYRDYIKTVNIGNGVTTISDCAFCYCTNLTSVSIPESVWCIGYASFESCENLESIVLPENLQYINGFAFWKCSSLETVSIPASVEFIGGAAFADCYSLKTITVDSENQYYSSDDIGALYNKEKTTIYQYPIGNTAKTYNIVSSVSVIDERVFACAEYLETVYIPVSVTSVGYAAFYACNNLLDIYYGGTQTQWSEISIEDANYSFDTATINYNHSGTLSGVCGDNLTWTLNTITGALDITGTGAMTEWGQIEPPWLFHSNYIKTVNIANGVTTISYAAFVSSTNLTSVTIPDSVTTIGDYAFAWCDSLTSVTIPDSVIAIGDYVFEDCDSLTSVTIPDSVTTIGDDLFYDCDSLTSVTIPDSVTTIGDNAFYSCDSLTSITIGNSVTTIGDYAFCACIALKTVTIPDSVTTIGSGTFFGCISLTHITVDANNKDYSSNSDGVLFNKDKTTLIQYPAGNTKTSYVIPDNVTTIGYGAFCYCSSLTEVTILTSVTSISNSALDYCDNLTDVYYTGTQAEWNKISIGKDNEDLTSATIHFKDVDYSGTCGDNLTWTLDTSTGVLNITGTGAMTDWSYVDTPWYSYYDYIKTANIADGVTTIGDGAFYRCYYLTSVTIPDSVTSIGDDAFCCCPNLTNLTIPDSVTSIGDSAFNVCGLTSVTIPYGVITIGEMTFESCENLKSVIIPNSVTTIDDYAFCACTNLESVIIPNSVTTIGTYAFSGCESLTSVKIGNNVKTIGEGAFNFCYSLPRITVDANNKYYSSDSYGVLFNKDKSELIRYPAGNTRTSYTIPDSVTTIDNNALEDCDNLTSITIPDSVTSIGDDAFMYCTSLKDVYYNGTQAEWKKVSIGENNEALLNAQMHFASVIDSGTCGESLTWSLYANGLLEITGTGEMWNYYYNPTDNSDPAPWLSNSSDVKTVLIDNGVTSIGNYAFAYCDNLTSVTIGNSVTSIGESAFEVCDSLTSITIPDSVTTISSSAFSYCTSLTSITIPDSVTTISSSAFRECDSLTNITVDANNKYYSSNNDGVLFNKDKTTLIQYPIGKTGTSYTIPDSVTTIGDYAFSTCDSLTSVTIPDSVTSIGNYAFQDCTSLTSVTIPDSVTTIGSSAFSSCDSLTSVTIPDSVTTIGDYAFEYCDSLTSITIPDSVNSIGSFVFWSCRKLASITVSANNKYYSSDSYGVLFNKDKTTLIQYPIGKTGTSYTIPDSVTTIGYYAFEYCDSLTSVTIPDSVTTIGYYAFYFCYNLYDVYYSGSEKQWNKISIGENNENLLNAKIHFESVNDSDNCGVNLIWTFDESTGVLTLSGTGEMYDYKSLGHTPWAEYNDRIVEITVNEGATSIGTGAFYGCYAVKNISLPSTLRNIGLFAFGACTAMEEINVSSDNEWYCSEDGIVYNKDKTLLVRYPAGKNATNFDIPDSVQTIGNEAFSDSVYLKNVNIPESVKKIDYHAFYGSQALEAVEIPASVEIIGNNVFDACYNLKAINVAADNSVYSSLNGVLFSKDGTELIYYPAAKGTSYTIPDGVKIVKENAFLFSNVNMFVIPKSVTVIEAAQCGYGSLIKRVRYSGTKAEWDAIYIDPSEGLNDALINANVSFYVENASNCKISIRRPDVKTVNYGDTLMFEAVVNNLPEGAKIVWKLSGDASAKLKVATDGMSCTVKVTGAGELKITASVVNEQGVPYKNVNGNSIASHKTFTAKAGFWEFIMWIFKSFFGTTPIYSPETLL